MTNEQRKSMYDKGNALNTISNGHAPNRGLTLSKIINAWKVNIRQWSINGEIVKSAKIALSLQNEQIEITQLTREWAKGDFSQLPSVELLPEKSMPGGVGAYAISNKTIYLNEEWLAKASRKKVIEVLTEELGHHLDGLFNRIDTPGDEGEVFASLLHRKNRIATETKPDKGKILVDTRWVNAEYSTNTAPTDIDLSTLYIENGISEGSAIATVFATDQAGDTLYWSYADGVGDADNGMFSGSGTSITINSSPDFDVKSSYSIRLEVRDQGGLTYQERFTLTVIRAPTDIILSSPNFNENITANSSERCR